MKATLTSSKYYAGLSRRYDKRICLLIKLGFKFDSERGGWYNPRREYLRQLGHDNIRIPPVLLQHADNRVFYDYLAMVTR